MKTLELNQMGLVELNHEEQINIEGGSFWSWLGQNIVGILSVIGLVLAVFGLTTLTVSSTNSDGTEEILYRGSRNQPQPL